VLLRNLAVDRPAALGEASVSQLRPTRPLRYFASLLPAGHSMRRSAAVLTTFGLDPRTAEAGAPIDAGFGRIESKAGYDRPMLSSM